MKQKKEEKNIVSEPSVQYVPQTEVAVLRKKLHDKINCIDDAKLLANCLSMLSSLMPCLFSDEEFNIEIEESEKSGFVTNEEAKRIFAKWL